MINSIKEFLLTYVPLGRIPTDYSPFLTGLISTYLIPFLFVVSLIGCGVLTDISKESILMETTVSSTDSCPTVTMSCSGTTRIEDQGDIFNSVEEIVN
jgi:hypothetical protein